MMPPIKSAPLTPEVPSCPFCGSTRVITVGKAADEEKYWRCCACGDIWNAGRLRFVAKPRWRR